MIVTSEMIDQYETSPSRVGNTAKMALFRGRRSSFFKTLKQLGAALLWFAVGFAAVCEAEPPAKDPDSTWVACGNSGITLALPARWEAVKTDYASVECAFRNSTSGLPTFNVLVEPRAGTAENLSVARQTDDLLASYHKVGLTDAVAFSSDLTLINGVPALQAVIKYHSKQKAMVAIVAQFTLSDRIYTATALDFQEAFRISEIELKRVVRSLVVPAPEASVVPVTGVNYTRSNVGMKVGLVVACIMTLLLGGFVFWRSARKQ